MAPLTAWNTLNYLSGLWLTGILQWLTNYCTVYVQTETWFEVTLYVRENLCAFDLWGAGFSPEQWGCFVRVSHITQMVEGWALVFRMIKSDFSSIHLQSFFSRTHDGGLFPWDFLTMESNELCERGQWPMTRQETCTADLIDVPLQLLKKFTSPQHVVDKVHVPHIRVGRWLTAIDHWVLTIITSWFTGVSPLPARSPWHSRTHTSSFTLLKSEQADSSDRTFHEAFNRHKTHSVTSADKMRLS